MRTATRIAYVMALLLVGGCTGTPTSSASPATSPPSTLAPSSASPSPANAYRENTKLVCAELKKVHEDQALAYVVGLTKYGPAHAVTDPKKQSEMIAVAKTALINWAAAVRALAPRAEDPALKQVINARADATEQASASITKWEDLTGFTGAGQDLPALAAAIAATDAICNG